MATVQQFAVVNYLIANAKFDKGVTARQISEALDLVSTRTVYRVLESMPGVKKCEYPVQPSHYYYDPSTTLPVGVGDKVLPHDCLSARAEFKPLVVSINQSLSDRENFNWFLNTLHGLIGNLTTITPAVAAWQADHNKPIPSEHWKGVKEDLAIIKTSVARLYMMLDHIEKHPKYDTPEWWAIFTEDIKEKK